MRFIWISSSMCEGAFALPQNIGAIWTSCNSVIQHCLWPNRNTVWDSVSNAVCATHRAIHRRPVVTVSPNGGEAMETKNSTASHLNWIYLVKLFDSNITKNETDCILPRCCTFALQVSKKKRTFKFNFLSRTECIPPQNAVFKRFLLRISKLTVRTQSKRIGILETLKVRSRWLYSPMIRPFWAAIFGSIQMKV